MRGTIAIALIDDVLSVGRSIINHLCLCGRGGTITGVLRVGDLALTDFKLKQRPLTLFAWLLQLEPILAIGQLADDIEHVVEDRLRQRDTLTDAAVRRQNFQVHHAFRGDSRFESARLNPNRRAFGQLHARLLQYVEELRRFRKGEENNGRCHVEDKRGQTVARRCQACRIGGLVEEDEVRPRQLALSRHAGIDVTRQQARIDIGCHH